MTGLPSSLEPDLLYLFVFGASEGECLLVRIPPDRWLIVDSFKCAGAPAAQAIVDKYGGHVDTIVMTHPHQDHFKGIKELLHRFASAVLGCVHPKYSPPTLTSAGLPVDPLAALGQGAKNTFDLVESTWNADVARKWETFRGSSKQIGDATVLSLHPQAPVPPDKWNSHHANEISSAMLVEWHGVRLLLGADVPNPYWEEIASVYAGINHHALLKVPHHASVNAFHDSFGLGNESRCWIATPFRSQRLPRFDDRDGVCKAHGYVKELHITSLPHRHSNESEAPCDTTRIKIRDNTHPTLVNIRGRLLQTSDALNRHVVASFKADGTLQMHHGPGSVRLGR